MQNTNFPSVFALKADALKRSLFTANAVANAVLVNSYRPTEPATVAETLRDVYGFELAAKGDTLGEFSDSEKLPEVFASRFFDLVDKANDLDIYFDDEELNANVFNDTENSRAYLVVFFVRPSSDPDFVVFEIEAIGENEEPAALDYSEEFAEEVAEENEEENKPIDLEISKRLVRDLNKSFFDAAAKYFDEYGNPLVDIIYNRVGNNPFIYPSYRAKENGEAVAVELVFYFGGNSESANYASLRFLKDGNTTLAFSESGGVTLKGENFEARGYDEFPETNFLLIRR